jgi:NMD protein affecting ribosome stability and mRNA decay
MCVVTKFRAGDVVRCNNDTRLGIVKKVGRKYVHVDWGTWEKPMLPEHLVKPKEVPMPGLSTDEVEVHLIQFDHD